MKYLVLLIIHLLILCSNPGTYRCDSTTIIYEEYPPTDNLRFKYPRSAGDHSVDSIFVKIRSSCANIDTFFLPATSITIDGVLVTNPALSVPCSSAVRVNVKGCGKIY